MPAKGQCGQVIAFHSIITNIKPPPAKNRNRSSATGAISQSKTVDPFPMPEFGDSGGSGSFGLMTQGNYITQACRTI